MENPLKPMREWSFRVEGVTAPGEVMCLTGSCDELGEWNPKRVVPMTTNIYENEDDPTKRFNNSSSLINLNSSTSHLFVPHSDGFSSTCETNRSTSNVWSVKMMIPDGLDVMYRYVVCMFVPPSPFEAASTDDRIVVRRWETNLKSRKIACHDRCDGKYQARFGFIPFRKTSYNIASSQPHPSEQSPPPSELFQRGWLIHETLVQLKFHGGSALQIWKQKHKNKDLFIKATPIETSKACLGNEGSSRQNSIDMEESTDIAETRAKRKVWPVVEVAKLNTEESEFQWQKQFGILYEDNAYIVFQAQVIDVTSVAFLIDVFARPKPDAFQRSYTNGGPSSDETENDEGPAEHIGSGYVMPEHFKSTEGRVKKPIISKKFQPIGQFVIDYLVIKPINFEETINKNPTKPGLSIGINTREVQWNIPTKSDDTSQIKQNNKCNFKVTYAKHWKSDWKGLEVAHRGLGNSYTQSQNCSTIRENTIASMKNAVLHGADMIEFDVQLSKDMIPVIYHEFELCLPSVSKKNGEHHLVEIPLKSLTLEQLHHLRLHHPSEKSGGLKTFPDHDEDHQPFPTLERALSVIDTHAGFNIEIKWDMENMDGTRESHNAFEMNVFVDAILKTVLRKAKSRKIVFSTFNPDICTVLRYKQNKYPVLFLTQGVNTKYDQYLDQRTHNVKNGSSFVATADILGLSVMAEDIQRDPTQIELVKSRGQVLFCWTDDQNNPEIVKYLKNLGVDGIIYDRIDENSAKETKKSIFLVEENEDEDEPNDDTDEQHVKSQVRSCSCSPPRNANSQDPDNRETPITSAPMEGIHAEENASLKSDNTKLIVDAMDVREDQKIEIISNTLDSDGDKSSPTSPNPEKEGLVQKPTFSGLFTPSAMVV